MQGSLEQLDAVVKVMSCFFIEPFHHIRVRPQLQRYYFAEIFGLRNIHPAHWPGLGVFRKR